MEANVNFEFLKACLATNTVLILDILIHSHAENKLLIQGSFLFID